MIEVEPAPRTVIVADELEPYPTKLFPLVAVSPSRSVSVPVPK
jgi:hypothetical protein